MKIGTLVECIAKYWVVDQDLYPNLELSFPKKSCIYEIRDCILEKDYYGKESHGYLLVEIHNPISPVTMKEPAFDSTEFRVLQAPMKINLEKILDLQLIK